jgi:excisionase family DNA binding protein
MAGMTSEREFLTIEEVLTVLRVSRTTFGRWRRQGTGPVIIRLPGGGVRIRRSALDRWLRSSRHPHGRTLAARGVVTLQAAGVKSAVDGPAPGMLTGTDSRAGALRAGWRS